MSLSFHYEEGWIPPEE